MASWIKGLKKDGNFWRYRFQHRGQLITGTTKCEKKADAEEYLRQKKAQLALGEVGVYKAPNVAHAFEAWLCSRESQSKAHRDRAKRALRLHVLPHIGDLRADRVTTEMIESVMARYRDGRGPTGRPHTPEGAATLMIYIKAVFNFLKERGRLRQIPFKLKKPRLQEKPRVYVKLSNLNAFLAKINEIHSEHVKVAILAMVTLGLRESEALWMKWAWLDEEAGTYTVGKAKGKEALPLPVGPQLLEALKKLPRTSEWVLPSKDGQPHRPQFTRKAIKAAGDGIGQPGLTPHRLRATFATLLDQQGASTYEIQKLLRHKQLATTLHYVQSDADSLRRAASRLWSQIQDPPAPPVPEAPKISEPPAPSDTSESDEAANVFPLRPPA
jgi:integrase